MKSVDVNPCHSAIQGVKFMCFEIHKWINLLRKNHTMGNIYYSRLAEKPAKRLFWRFFENQTSLARQFYNAVTDSEYDGNSRYQNPLERSKGAVETEISDAVGRRPYVEIRT